MDWNAVWLWLQRFGGIVGAAAVVAAASYPVWLPHLKDFIAGWMDRRFKKQMQDADHAFQEKVRHVQSAIDRELDRARKLQDREFEALSKAWEILHEAFWKTREATNQGYQVVDVAAMHDDQLDEFVASLEFPGWRKKQLLEMIRGGAEDEAIQKYYVKGWRTKQYSDCQKWRIKLVQYIDRNGIFMQPEIKDRFDRLHQLIADALLEFELRIRDIDVPINPYDEHIRSDALRAAENGLYVELENLIRQRIWSPVQPAGI
ncbi:MAG: hypothetical protein ACK4F6_12720 [Hylemonella sp.]